jgi:hypothetical protein
MNETSAVERAFVWVGFAGMAVCFIGIGVADLLPPPSPDQTADQIADFYQSETNAFRIGTICMGFGGMLITPWMAVIARRLHRIPEHGPFAGYCFLGLGMLLMYQIVMPITTGQAVAFRTERPVEDTAALSDLFMIQLISPSYVYIVQLIVMGVAVLADTSAVLRFPRWVGYLSLWVAAGSFFSVVVLFFKTGPFAWDGLFGWWIPLLVFGTWVVAVSVTLLRPAGGQPIAVGSTPMSPNG